MLEKFCDSYWPCSFVDRYGRPCVSTKQGHDPTEHRCLKGKVIGNGSYVSGFTATSYGPEWICFLKEEINACREEYWEALDEFPLDVSNERIVSSLHLEQMNDYFGDLGSATSYVSHTSCFCCLVDIPRHPLPCGHVLCHNCVREYGEKNHNGVQLNYCPLHTYTTFSPPWEITLKPDHAGVRVLCLDGYVQAFSLHEDLAAVRKRRDAWYR